MNRSAFEQLVAEELAALPETYRERLDNVAVLVEDWPDLQAVSAAGASHPAGVLGLYQGVPLERRTHNYSLVVPDKITLYRRSIELRCRSLEEVRSMIQHVVRHEIAHHFGIDDGRLRAIGAY